MYYLDRNEYQRIVEVRGGTSVNPGIALWIVEATFFGAVTNAVPVSRKAF